MPQKNSPLRRLELEPRKNCRRVREGPRHGSLGSSEPCYINLAARWKSNDWPARSRYLYRMGPKEARVHCQREVLPGVDHNEILLVEQYAVGQP